MSCTHLNFFGFPDRDLERRISNFLHRQNVPGAEDLHVHVVKGTVVIRGRLPSSSAKRACVECCRHVAGVANVVDKVQVPEFIADDFELETPVAERGRYGDWIP